jgi:hypothetical protein
MADDVALAEWIHQIEGRLDTIEAELKDAREMFPGPVEGVRSLNVRLAKVEKKVWGFGT